MYHKTLVMLGIKRDNVYDLTYIKNLFLNQALKTYRYKKQ